MMVSSPKSTFWRGLCLQKEDFADLSVRERTMYLMSGVILGGEAVAAGRVTRHELGRWYTTIFHGVYVPKNAELSLRDRAIAAWLASGRKGVVAGVVASALHGAPWVDPAHPVELVGVKCRAQNGLVPRTERIDDDDIIQVSGLRGDDKSPNGLSIWAVTWIGLKHWPDWTR